MSDLVVAGFVLTTLSSIVFVTGWCVARRWSWQAVLALATCVLVALLIFVFRFHGTWHMARVVPFSGAIILGNWILPGGAFLAGVTLGQRNSHLWRRCILAGLILLVSAYSIVCCFQGRLSLNPSNIPVPRWSYQSQVSSCGACCAALLLNHHGIEASEEEMLDLCLTSHRGSPALGVYRGLKLKIAGTPWDVEVVSCSVEELLDTVGPLLLRIEIQPMTRWEGKHEVMERRTYRHAVLLLRTDEQGRAVIRDPAVFRHSLSHRDAEDLRREWLGEALRLVPRNGI